MVCKLLRHAWQYVLAYFYLEHCNEKGLKKIGDVNIEKVKMHQNALAINLGFIMHTCHS